MSNEERNELLRELETLRQENQKLVTENAALQERIRHLQAELDYLS